MLKFDGIFMSLTLCPIVLSFVLSCNTELLLEKIYIPSTANKLLLPPQYSQEMTHANFTRI